MVQQTIAPSVIRDQWFRMSFDVFLVWGPDESQSQWVDGEGIADVSTRTRHGEMVDFLADLLRRFVAVFALGRASSSQVLLKLPNRPFGRMPDICVVSSTELERVRPQWVEASAMIVFEFISDETEQQNLFDKRIEYENAGFPEYVPIDARSSRAQCTDLRLGIDSRYVSVKPDKNGRYHSHALPGLWLDPQRFEGEQVPDVEDVLLDIAPDAYAAWLLKKI